MESFVVSGELAGSIAESRIRREARRNVRSAAASRNVNDADSIEQDDSFGDRTPLLAALDVGMDSEEILDSPARRVGGQFATWSSSGYFDSSSQLSLATGDFSGGDDGGETILDQYHTADASGLVLLRGAASARRYNELRAPVITTTDVSLRGLDRMFIDQRRYHDWFETRSTNDFDSDEGDSGIEHDGASDDGLVTGNENRTKQQNFDSASLESWAWRDSLFFFVVGVGMLMAKNSFLGIMPYFVRQHGPQAQPTMLAAYNIPSLPVFFMQMRWDGLANARFGHKSAYFARGLFAFLGLLVCVFLFNEQSLTAKLPLLVAISGGIGFMTATLYGTLFQFASHFPTKCTPLLLLGNGVSCLILIVVSIPLHLLGSSDQATPAQIFEYFGFASFFLVVSALCFFGLLTSPTFLRDLAWAKSLNRSVGDGSAVALLNGKTQPPVDVSLLELAKTIRTPLLSIFINMFTTVLINVFLSYVPSSGLLGMSLVQILNYANTIADFMGRQLVVFQRLQVLKSNVQVLYSVLARCVLTCMFVWYVFWSTEGARSDVGALVFVVLYAAFGGYSNTMIYTVFQMEGQETLTSDSRARGTTILNVGLQIGVFLALPLPFLFSPK